MSNVIVFDPNMGNHFSVEIEGLEWGKFQEVSGLGMTIDAAYEVKEGGLNAHTHKFATRADYNDITFKRGYCNFYDLFDWVNNCALGTWTGRRNGSITWLNEKNIPLSTLNFYRAFPVKWDSPAFNAMSSSAAIESLTLKVEWIELM